MKDVVLLTKVLFKSASSRTKKEFNKKSHIVFTVIIFLFIYCYLAGIVGYCSYEAVKSLMLIEKENIFLNIVFCGALGFSIFQSIFNSINVLFFSKDLDMLLPLPINPIKIIMAKFNCLVISQYLMYGIVLLPIIAVYGYLLNLSILFYLYCLLVILIFPVIPVVITSFFVTIVMKFTNIIKNKETVQYITVLLSIVIIFFVQFGLGSSNNEITNEELANKLISINESLDSYTNVFINIKTAVNGISNYNNINGIIYFIGFIIETLIVYVLISFITSKFYTKTVTSVLTNGIKKSRKVDLNSIKKNSVIKSYIKKELRVLVRNPIFFMQCLVPPLLFPLVFLVPSLVSLNNSIGDVYILKEYLTMYINTSIGLISCIEIIELFYIFNFATITSISRDGNNAIVMKYIPIDLLKQCKYKSLLGIILNVIPVLYVLVIVKIFLPGTKIITLLYIFILSLLINIFNNWLVIIVDLVHPKLDWMTEYAVVKQNLNMFFQMVIITIEMIIIFLIGFKIVNLNIAMAFYSILFIVLIFTVKQYIRKNQIKLFNKII